MFPNIITTISRREKTVLFSGLALLAAASAFQPRLSLLKMPADLGHLVPKGKINPDGSEVWGYPEGSDLDGVVEIHVRNGRVVREVLRPSAQPSGEAVASALSDSSEPDAVR